MLGSKRGDQQSRAELLGEFLIATGDKPYMLQHGAGQDLKHLILLRLSAEDLAALAAAIGEAPPVVKVGRTGFVSLPLEAGMTPGQIPPGLYDVEKNRWNGTVALMRYK